MSECQSYENQIEALAAALGPIQPNSQETPLTLKIPLIPPPTPSQGGRGGRRRQKGGTGECNAVSFTMNHKHVAVLRGWMQTHNKGTEVNKQIARLLSVLATTNKYYFDTFLEKDPYIRALFLGRKLDAQGVQVLNLKARVARLSYAGVLPGGDDPITFKILQEIDEMAFGYGFGFKSNGKTYIFYEWVDEGYSTKSEYEITSLFSNPDFLAHDPGISNPYWVEEDLKESLSLLLNMHLTQVRTAHILFNKYRVAVAKSVQSGGKKKKATVTKKIAPSAASSGTPKTQDPPRTSAKRPGSSSRTRSPAASTAARK